MQETILIIYLVVSIALVGIILLQQGKGAEMGASFGAGGANTVFGAAGSGNALTKATTILAILFFATALSISYINATPEKNTDAVFDEAPAVEKVDIESALPTEAETKPGIETERAPADQRMDEATKAGAEKAKGTEQNTAETLEPDLVEPSHAGSQNNANNKEREANPSVTTEKKQGDNQ